MADGTKIEWTDATWNPVTGCSIASPGCIHCYAMRLAGTRLKHHPSRAGLTIDTKTGPVWNGEVRFNGQWLDQPLRWKTPRRIFVCAHGDLFHEDVPDAWIDQVFAVMALCPQHTFQVLTKRAERMHRYCADVSATGPGRGTITRIADALHDIAPAELRRRWPLPNVWLGVSCENQEWADKRVPLLLDTPAAVRWVSAEPLIGPIDFANHLHRYECHDCFNGRTRVIGHFFDEQCPSCAGTGKEPSLDWIVAGGESGPMARPMHPDWARVIRDQCAAAGVAFHFKQWGEYGPCEIEPPGSADLSVVTSNGRHLVGSDAIWGEPGDAGAEIIGRFGKKRAGRLLDGVTHDGFPNMEARRG